MNCPIIPSEPSCYDLTQENFPVAHLVRGEEKKRLCQPVSWPMAPETKAMCDALGNLADMFLLELSCAIQTLTKTVRKYMAEGWEVDALNIGVDDGTKLNYHKVGEWTLFKDSLASEEST